MSQDAWIFVAFSTVYLLLFASAELIYRLGKVKGEYTRKYVHVGSGLIGFAFPFYFTSHWWVLALGIAFLALLVVSFRIPGLLPSINAVERFTTGSLLYPVAVYLSFLAYVHFRHLAYFYLPVGIMAIADPVAALVGRRWGKRKFTLWGDSKSWVGSAAFFLTAFAVALLVSFLPDLTGLHSASFTNYLLISCFFIALVATLAELVGVKGTDNLTIPVAVILALVGIEYLFFPFFR